MKKIFIEYDFHFLSSYAQMDDIEETYRDRLISLTERRDRSGWLLGFDLVVRDENET